MPTNIRYSTEDITTINADLFEFVWMSDDLQHYIYSESKNARGERVVIDGVQSEYYDEVGYRMFTPITRQYLYEYRNNSEWKVVHNGKTYPAYSGMEEYPKFSHDGEHVYYLVKNEGVELFLIDHTVVDTGKQFRIYPSFDERLSYVKRSDSKRNILVSDGALIGEFDAVNYVYYSRNGNNIAYTIESNGKECVVINGNPQPEYAEICWFRFSDHSDSYAYSALTQSGWVVVHNDEIGNHCCPIKFQPPVS